MANQVVQLGFLDVWRPNEDRTFDQSRVGGHPIFPPNCSNPFPYPTCEFCGNALLFLLQLYAPLVSHPEDEDRILYLFICQHGTCIAHGSVKLFRVQVPSPDAPDLTISKVNTTTDPQPAPVEEEAKPADDDGWQVSTGKRQKKTKAQKEHARQQALATSKNAKPKIFLREFEVTTEEEGDPVELKGDPAKERRLYQEYLDQGGDSAEEEVIDVEDNMPDDDEPEPSTTVNVDDFDEEKPNDKIWMKFLKRIARAPQQCLRYNIENAKPLWVAEDSTAIVNGREGRILKSRNEQYGGQCTVCGAQRTFEFQVMPQILSYLDVEKSMTSVCGEDTPDFGTILVYTCPNSCDLGAHQYCVEETVAVQMIPPKEG
ncbi:putative Programmed cell death protein 2 [Blattamonas nauphoetae]|uniref:Programmed cell death protein 2 n=1 Tax=Blattamonas nauphoetae TaxID=2049346 RepID=A0ABQ9XWF1_9EUKA|nr:putative Programmed cell death protein 2 [Blattamonas nauphoetae]